MFSSLHASSCFLAYLLGNHFMGLVYYTMLISILDFYFEVPVSCPQLRQTKMSPYIAKYFIRERKMMVKIVPKTAKNHCLIPSHLLGNILTIFFLPDRDQIYTVHPLIFEQHHYSLHCKYLCSNIIYIIKIWFNTGIIHYCDKALYL